MSKYNLIKNGIWLSFSDNLGSGIFLPEGEKLVITTNGQTLVDVVMEQVERQENDWPWVSLYCSIYKSGIPAKIGMANSLALIWSSDNGSNLILKMDTINSVSGKKNVYSTILPAAIEPVSVLVAIGDIVNAEGNPLSEKEEVIGFSFYNEFPREGGRARIKIEEFFLLGFKSPDNRIAELYKKMDLGHMAIELLNCHFVFEFLTKHNITRTLEVGLGEGASAMAIMSATGQQHTAIDPLTFCTKGIDNMKAIGMLEQLRLCKSLSQFALPKLCEANEKFQFSFVAGGCKFEDFFNDFTYLSQMTEMGGYIMIPDNELPSMPTLIRYIAANRPDFIAVETPEYYKICLWQKVTDDNRDWDHHVNF